MAQPVTFITKKFEASTPGPSLLITGGVHGDEFEPMAAIRRLMLLLETLPLAKGSVTLIPVVNEPAFDRGGRTAEDGLDLARTCPGKEDGSITERIAAAISPIIREADFYIDLHTGGTEFSILPMSGYTLHADLGILEQQRAMAHAFNLPVCWGTSPTLHGRTLSIARDAGVPAIYAEYGGGGGFNPSGADAYVEGCLNVMGRLGLIQRDPPGMQVRHTVEDSRENSGHMQVQNPSPIRGLFHPIVGIGQHVREGDLLGTVCDLTGENEVEIHSQQTGIVLVLRTFPRVLADQALAVILEI